MARPPRTSHARSRARTPVSPRRGRRTLWSGLALLVVGLAGALWWWTRGGSPAGPLILISIDTLRADRLPVYGYNKGRTPALDAFAKDAIVFDRAYAHAPQTLPSHASMFTGLLPFEHKVRDNLGFTLPAGSTTLASVFRSAGYRTAGFASAFVLRSETGVAQGFEVYDADLATGRGRAGTRRDPAAGSGDAGGRHQWLNTLADGRFLLFFHIYEPHAPYTPPAQFASLTPTTARSPSRTRLSANCLACFVNDSGTTARRSSSRPITAKDSTITARKSTGSSSTRRRSAFPWTIKLPNQRRGGSRTASLVQHIDLLPTLAGLAGLAATCRPAGPRSLQPLLMGRGEIAAQGIYAEALYPRYHFGWSELTTLVDGRYKFIKAPRPELYDLERDPRERENLIDARAQPAAALRSGLDAMVAGRPVDAPGSVSAEDRERLAALGYVGTRAPVPAGTSGDALPDPKDKVGTLVMYREAVDLISARKYEEGVRVLEEGARRQSGHGRRVDSLCGDEHPSGPAPGGVCGLSRSHPPKAG